MVEPGVLYVVATPIGNKSDMSPRAVEILQEVDVVAAEDTRHSRPLLEHFQVNTRCVAYHEHNEPEKALSLVKQLEAGQSIALISDAGTPLISDPGFRVVQLARDKGLRVVPIPGPCALIAALSASGIACDQFHFIGFLPVKSGPRIKKLAEYTGQAATLIFYESKHRLLSCLEDVRQAAGEGRRIALAKELTKNFESIVSGTVDDVLQWLDIDERHRKGEFVVLIEGHQSKDGDLPQLAIKLVQLLKKEMPLKTACKITAEHYGVSKNELYRLCV